MIYNEVNKFFSKPRAKASVEKTSSQFLNELHKIALEPPIQLKNLKKAKAKEVNSYVESDLGGGSMLDASDLSHRSAT